MVQVILLPVDFLMCMGEIVIALGMFINKT